ncbi:hypothetical protein [Candidatus Amarolinea aalborgensis]|jgi:hypothetical protein|uniref:hypothetical protein n=1 Tax=Candidatus Amarolinea aalborgensis TaxID=2249329 RepID=UPI003BF97C22
MRRRIQPPVLQAVIAFVQAESDDAAETLFAQERLLLQPYEAQRLLDEAVTSDDLATLQRITECRALLRRLRGAEPRVPQPMGTSDEDGTAPTFASRDAQVTGDLYLEGATLVVSEFGLVVNPLPVALFANRPTFNNSQWSALTAGLEELGRIANDSGLRLCYHPHAGTGVMIQSDSEGYPLRCRQARP